jgi:hypothetical protein
VRPVAVTKEERDIVDGAAARKILTFLRGTAGQWHSTVEVNDGAHLRTNAAGAVLKRLGEEGKVRFCTGDAALALGRKKNAHLWTVDRATAGDVGEPMEPEPA